jgi:beta-ureidopropionase / N-carbamoyl-L-amino-acid hydrolase
MMFVQSLRGISHNKLEDTKEEHLESAVVAFDKLAEKTMAWFAKYVRSGLRKARGR